jgi:hypothetical protein
MTKLQMQDSILFALDELGKAKAALEQIKNIDIEKRPDGFASALMGEVVAYNFGRAEGLVSHAEMWLTFGIATLTQCVKQELAVMADVREGSD